MWVRARAGTLKPGAAAPDFRLKTLDKSSEISLSSFRGRSPVVLVFGSYT
jgi:peroxiredoxin